MFCTRNTAAVLYFVIAMLASTLALGCSGMISASDPEAGRAANEAEARAAAETALANELSKTVAVQVTGGLTTMDIDLPAVQSYCRSQTDQHYDDCVTVRQVLDALAGDCEDCRSTLGYRYSVTTGRVVEIDLYGKGLAGSIPPEIGNLTGLIRLWLSYNQLTGPIPPQIGNLTNLRVLNLNSNQLTGPIPPELGDLTNLIYLTLDSNSLTGCVPASLQDAYMGNDSPICGTALQTPTATATTTPILITPTTTPTPTATPLPDTCGAAVTDTSNTGLVSDCNALLVARDTLRGTAALNWAPNTSISRWNGIALGGSPQRVIKVKLQKRSLSGQIPAALGRLDALEELWLYTNALTGTIPPEMGNLSNLRWLLLASNKLSGQIPETLNNLTLDRLWLYDNDFTGCVPYNLTLTREYWVDRDLPACAPPTGSPTPTPTPGAGTPTPTPEPGATPTPTPTAVPGDTSARLTAIEGRLDDIERRLAALETAVAGLTGTPTATAGGR